jgi:hypothetical protein
MYGRDACRVCTEGMHVEFVWKHGRARQRLPAEAERAYRRLEVVDTDELRGRKARAREGQVTGGYAVSVVGHGDEVESPLLDLHVYLGPVSIAMWMHVVCPCEVGGHVGISSEGSLALATTAG